ncbi:hypothetical protein cypCar_00020257 [Cyprinus carpio]|nr:hypothetical protein cypCar_00020257 [Cyprinus carpio]
MLRAAALSLLPWRGTRLSHPLQLSTLTEEDEPERQQQEEEDEDEGSGVQPDPMFQQTAYLLEGPEDMVVSPGGLKSPDWVYESYYRMSLQHPLIVFLLLIVMGACLALLAVFFASGLTMEEHMAFIMTVPTTLAIFLAIFILVCIESVFKKLLRLFSLLVWGCLVAMGYLFMFFGGIICPWDQVSFFLFIVFVVYTMLPFSMRDAVIASVLTSSSHTLVLSIWLSNTTDHMEALVWAVKTIRSWLNIIIFICGNVRREPITNSLMDMALKQTYQTPRNCIKSPIKLEFEKHQQNNYGAQSKDNASLTHCSV